MNVQENSGIERGAGRYDSEYTAESITALDAQFKRGDIEPHSYRIKKQALVGLFLKSTTNPKRKRRDYGETEI